jgi:hypothetical protein
MKPRNVLLAVVALCSLIACDPFELSGASTNEDMVVPQNEVASIELLVPSRKLPPSANNVRLHVRHFQDTSLHVKFDADAGEARAFAESLLGRPLARTGSKFNLEHGPKLDWWISQQQLAHAEYGEDMVADGNDSPPVAIALVQNGKTATVWVETFTI